jgi:3-phenylpropionate/cinnamic acid dioxygenase small subunit
MSSTPDLTVMPTTPVTPDERLAVEALIRDYAFALDDGEYERWPAFFAEQCFYQIRSRESRDMGHPLGMMYCTSAAMMRDRISGLRRVNVFEPHRYRHVTGSPWIARLPDGTYRARTSYVLVRTMRTGESTLFSSGCYEDVIALSASGPRFLRREVICESSQIDTLLVIPI